MSRRFHRRPASHTALVAGLTLAIVGSAGAQRAPGEQGSSNFQVLGHIPLGRSFSSSDLEIESEVARPFVYTSRMLVHGFNIISVKDPENPTMLYAWQIENPDLHAGTGGMDNKYFKLRDRYYDVQGFQFGRSGPDADLGAVVHDVTGLPDVSTIREIGRIRSPEFAGGFHNIFAYKHSDGRVLLFTTSTGPHANVYDMEKFISGGENQGLIGRVPSPPSQNGATFYHDFFVGYHAESGQDRFYGATQGAAPTGDRVYDVTSPETPRLIATVIGAAGIQKGHTFTPTPDGRYVLSQPQYESAPVRVFDLKPALEGEAKTVSRSIGAWIVDWKAHSHNSEIRWPYVFMAAYQDGVQVLNIMDPTNPYTVGFYDTYDGPHARGWGGVRDPDSGTGVANGAFGVDIRNADGLVVVEDFKTGFWVLRMDGFDGWNGHQWGVPNVSSEQDWDNGPDGAPKPVRVSVR